MRPPQAEVIGRQGKWVKVLCPHCHNRHAHAVTGEGKQRFAPGCSMFLSGDKRAAGYEFKIYK